MSAWRVLAFVVVVTVVCAADRGNPASASAAESEPSLASLWEAPTDLATRDLFSGPWGAEYAPDPNAVYTFVKPKTGGVNPGVIVRDPRGRTWHVKQPQGGSRGDEGPAEVVLSRVLSALGYHQPPVYFLPDFTMAKGKHRDQKAGGRFRLEEESLRDRGSWSWRKNPFVGTRPYQGLLVILLAFNSWDLKDSNNTRYEVRRESSIEQWFVVRDLGGALGESGKFFVERNNIDEFEEHRFITGVDDGFVEFDYGGKQPVLVRDRITVDDVQWATRLLESLSDRQWHDAFRAGGYSPAIRERFIRKIRTNIAAGQQLAGLW